MLISEKRLKLIIREEIKKRYLLKELSETDAWAEIVKILEIPSKPTKSQHKKAWNKWINDRYNRRGDEGPKATELRFDADYVSVIKDMPGITGNGPYERVYSFLKTYGESGGAKGASVLSNKYANQKMNFNIASYGGSESNWDNDVTFQFNDQGLIDLEEHNNDDQMWNLVTNIIDSLDWPVTNVNIKSVYDVVKKLRPVGVKREGDVFYALQILSDRYNRQEGETLSDDLEDHKSDMSGKAGEQAEFAAKWVNNVEEVGALGKAWRALLSKLMESDRKEKLQLILRHVVKRQKQQRKNKILKEASGKLLLELDPPGGYAESETDDPLDDEYGESEQTEEEIEGTKPKPPGKQEPKKSGSKKKRSGGSGVYSTWTGWPMTIKKSVKGKKTEEVGKLQAKIGTKADGYFGSNSVTALKVHTKKLGKEIAEVDKDAYDKIMAGKQLAKETAPGDEPLGVGSDPESDTGKKEKKKDKSGIPVVKGALGRKKIKYDKKKGNTYIYQAKDMNIPRPKPTPKWWRWAGKKIDNVEITTLKPMPAKLSSKWGYANIIYAEMDMGNYSATKDKNNWRSIINFLYDEKIIAAIANQSGTTEE